MSDPSVDVVTPEATPVVTSPPPAERVSEPMSDPRQELLQLAATLQHTRNTRLLLDYLRLRRAAR